jgi:hypothetical protein
VSDGESSCHLYRCWVGNHLSEATPLPPPNVSIVFHGYLPETSICDLVKDTNVEGQYFYESSSKSAGPPDCWFYFHPISDKLPLKQTNVLSELYFTNRGPTAVWWTAQACRVEARTPSGWMTNVVGPPFSMVPAGVEASGKEIFRIYVPINASEWRIASGYTYLKYERYNRDILMWILNGIGIKNRSGFALDISALGPESDEEFKFIYSGYFTNKSLSNLAP